MGLGLSHKEVNFYRPDIELAFVRILNHPWFKSRPNSKQWQFFRHCFEVLMGKSTKNYDCTDKEAVNYKFEISDRLRRYYLSGGERIDFVFQLESVKKEGVDYLSEPDYPQCNGYRLRVFFNKDTPDKIQLRKLLVEKCVEKAIRAEFEAYESLSDRSLETLSMSFDSNGAAYKKIANLVRAHRRKGLILSNKDNPSTVRPIDIKIKELSDKSAQVVTREYWLLMWWSKSEARYVYTYNEVNRQNYFLAHKGKHWIIVDNPYPKPSRSTPRRSLRRLRAEKGESK
jgi:hypothetical protein